MQGRTAKRARRSVTSTITQVKARSAEILREERSLSSKAERLCGLSGLRGRIQAISAWLVGVPSSPDLAHLVVFRRW